MALPKIHIPRLVPAPGGGFYDANLPHRPVDYGTATPARALEVLKHAAAVPQLSGVPRPKDVLNKLPKQPQATSIPTPPATPQVPKVQQVKLETPNAAEVKPIRPLPTNMGPTPLNPSQPANFKVADAIAELEKIAEEAQDRQILQACIDEGLYAPEGQVYDGEKQAFVPADAARITVNAQKDKDLELWRAYKANPSALTLSPLMRALEPAINSEVNRWAGNVPRAVLEMEAKRLTLEAIKTYDPNKGTALATHVHNRLYKLSRTVYSNQDIVRMPENKKLKSQTFYNGNEFLKGELGREPTQVELADHLGWNVKTVKDVQRSMVDEFVESKDEGASDFLADREDQDPLLDYVYHSLNPTDQKIYEMSTGYNGQKPLTAAQIGTKLNMNQNQVAYRRRVITEQVERARALRS